MNGPEFLPPLPPRHDPRVALATVLDGGRDAVLGAVEQAGGALVEDHPDRGTALVTFARAAAAGRPEEAVLLLLDTLTHMHRDQLAHFALERLSLEGGDLHAITVELPRELRCTAAFLLQDRFDASVAQQRSTWSAVYSRTVELGPRGEVIHAPGGGRASVLSLPGAPPQAHVDAAASPAAARQGAPHLTEHTIDSSALGMPIRIWASTPNQAPQAVAIVCDGDRLGPDVPVAGALAAAQQDGSLAPMLALLFAPADPSQRAEVLGMNPGLARFIESELLPWARALWALPRDPSKYLIAGASLGGLAAADVVRRIPGTVGTALVQSGSFWWPAGDEDVAEGEQLRRWASDAPSLPPHVRVFHEVGTQEGHLRRVNREFRALSAASGVKTYAREYEGGHDYACWRAGLVEALTLAFPGRRPASAAPHSQSFARLTPKQEHV